MSFTEIRSVNYLAKQNQSENSREKTFTETFLPSANSRFYAIISEAISNCKPQPVSAHTVQNELDQDYFTINFETYTIDHHSKNSSSYSFLRNPPFATYIGRELFSELSKTLSALPTIKDYNPKLTNLWYDYFCLAKIFLSIGKINNDFVNLVVNLGRHATMQIIIALNSMKFKIPDGYDLSTFSRVEKMFDNEKRFEVEFLDITGKTMSFRYNVKISKPRTSRFEKVNVMSSFAMSLDDAQFSAPSTSTQSTPVVTPNRIGSSTPSILTQQPISVPSEQSDPITTETSPSETFPDFGSIR